MKHHLAFKVTWVYGKRGPFTSPCDAHGRIVNIRKEKKVWCSQEENPCRQILLDEVNNGAPDEIPCYDAAVFKQWAFGGGVYHNGQRVGEPIRISHVQPGSFGFFTSKRHGEPEDARVIIGCFEIAEPESEADPDWGFRVTSVPSSRVRLRDLENAPKFWRFHHQNGPPRWGTGLFRYPRTLRPPRGSSLHGDFAPAIRGRLSSLRELKCGRCISPAPCERRY